MVKDKIAIIADAYSVSIRGLITGDDGIGGSPWLDIPFRIIGVVAIASIYLLLLTLILGPLIKSGRYLMDHPLVFGLGVLVATLGYYLIPRGRIQ